MGNAATWRVVVEVPQAEAETAEYAFGELGALGSLEQESADPGARRIVAYFDSREFEREGLRDLVSDSFSAFPGLAGAWIEVELEPARDWNERWREFFKPFELARGFTVVPSWESYDAKPGERIIHIDPGMAFGTGLHETTRLCAETLISEAAKAESLLDVGTGSGILAILGHSLGIGRIAGVEIDPEAMRVARENFGKNGCDSVELASELDSIEGSFDCVIANILLKTLIDLKGAIADRVAPGGTLILSGITREQEVDIIDAYSPKLVHARTEHRGEWSAVVMRRAVAAPSPDV
jgi:ribosomal protein L11 methyltransferase